MHLKQGNQIVNVGKPACLSFSLSQQGFHFMLDISHAVPAPASFTSCFSSPRPPYVFLIHLLFSVVNKQICHLLSFVFALLPPPPLQTQWTLSQWIADNAAVNSPLLQGSFACGVPKWLWFLWLKPGTAKRAGSFIPTGGAHGCWSFRRHLLDRFFFGRHLWLLSLGLVLWVYPYYCESGTLRAGSAVLLYFAFLLLTAAEKGMR